MRGIINSGHEDEEKLQSLAEFRDWLIKLRENNDNRMDVRRNGTSKYRDDGSRVYGPFTLPIRSKILKRLLKLSNKLGEQLITKYEIEIIEEIWRVDKIQAAGRDALMQSIAVD